MEADQITGPKKILPEGMAIGDLDEDSEED